MRWAAAVLNLIPFPIGLGYVLLGRWGRAIVSFFLRVVLGSVFSVMVLGAALFGADGLSVTFAVLGWVVTFGVTAVDAWLVAEKKDSRTSPRARHGSIDFPSDSAPERRYQ